MEIGALLRAAGRNKTGPLLVAAQMAIGLMIFANVAYIVVFRLEATARPTGMDTANMFWLTSEGYGSSYDHAATTQADLIYLNSIPGVIAASISSALPQTFAGMILSVSTEPAGNGAKTLVVYYQMSQRAAETLGLNLVSGRALHADTVVNGKSDTTSTQVDPASEVLITEALAHALFGNEPALGKTVYVGLIDKSKTVVGVVESMQAAPYFGPQAEFVNRVMLVPSIGSGPSALYIVRTRPGERDDVMRTVERDFESRLPNRYLDRIERFDYTAALTRAPMRTGAVILIVVAVCVLAVTALGIFGLAAFTVTSRVRQIGTRRALGARKFHILRYFVIENWLVMTLGVLAGCALSVALGLKLAAALQMPRLPLIYIAAGVLVIWVVGTLAALVPAMRAAAISPAIATKSV